MKKLFLLLIILFPGLVSAQEGKYKTETKTDKNGYSYQSVSNDPLAARIYTLKNGLTVYLSVYKDVPRIQTFIAVRAGSKNDPANTTGLAHYLEHILFKGTSNIGSGNWDKEKAEIKKIEALYEVYRNTTDSAQRKKIYHQIDSISLVASSYSIANEYDKLLSNIGAVGTNAYTFVEQTVYVNDIPANQVEKWAEIEGERFSMVVPRLFHTELEAVYEEKNKGLDNDKRKVWEATMSGLFKKHPYGTQTTIGTVEHLKNPSIVEIEKYFKTYYVPNNMALCLSGDLDPEKTIQAVDKYFSKLVSAPVPAFTPPAEDPITKPIVQNIYGPDAENITIAFRTPGIYTQQGDSIKLNKDPYYLKMLSLLLANGEAGLIDLQLNQQQKTLGAYCYEMCLNDFSVFELGARPREGQALESVTTLLLGELDSVKAGKFEDWLVKAVINDYKITKMKSYESNRERADAFVDAFISHRQWQDYIQEPDILSRITKQEIVDYTNKNFSNNYEVIYKRVGVDTTIKKVPKPAISPVQVNREKHSEFYKQVMAQPSPAIQPQFLDYTKDLKKLTLKNKAQVLYRNNNENGLFNLYYVWETGNNNDPGYGIAAEYFRYLGTKKYSPERLKEEFFKLGCSYNVSATSENVYITLSGLNENFEEALKLLEQFIATAKPDAEALKNQVQGILKSRADNKLSKDAILRGAMVSYAKYGPVSPFTNILSEAQLNAIKPQDLISKIQQLSSFNHHLLYYGPKKENELVSILEKLHKTPSTLKELPPLKRFPFKDITENEVYFVDYNMVQAEVVILSKSITYTPTLSSTVYLFNEYFGGGMGSLVFQEMRESKALAYSVRSKYEEASRKNYPNYVSSYIGTQADKLGEALSGMQELIEDMPESDFLFANAKNAIIENMNSERTTKMNILQNYERAQKLGLDYDIRKNIYDDIKVMTFNDIKEFQKKYMKGQKKIVLVVGSKDKIKLSSLEKYGKVRQLTLKEIFGY